MLSSILKYFPVTSPTVKSRFSSYKTVFSPEREQIGVKICMHFLLSQDLLPWCLVSQNMWWEVGGIQFQGTAPLESKESDC